MIWNRLSILQGFIPFTARKAAARRARRWTEAARRDAHLAEDLIILGNVLATQPATMQDGWPTPALPDPQRLAYEAGRRDLALQLLALMSLTPAQLATLVKEPDYDPPELDY